MRHPGNAHVLCGSKLPCLYVEAEVRSRGKGGREPVCRAQAFSSLRSGSDSCAASFGNCAIMLLREVGRSATERTRFAWRMRVRLLRLSVDFRERRPDLPHQLTMFAAHLDRLAGKGVGTRNIRGLSSCAATGDRTKAVAGIGLAPLDPAIVCPNSRQAAEPDFDACSPKCDLDHGS